MALLQHLEEPSAPQPKGFALFALGFRPFYLLASIFAALSVPLWALQFAGLLPRPYLSGVVWHAHEMLFGFTLAVIVGFLLTAGRNWTNLPTPTGAKLCALVALWLLARVLVLTPYALAAAVANVAFPGGSRRAGGAVHPGAQPPQLLFRGAAGVAGCSGGTLPPDGPGCAGHAAVGRLADRTGYGAVHCGGHGRAGHSDVHQQRGARCVCGQAAWIEKVALGSVLVLLLADAFGLQGWPVAAVAAVACVAHLCRWLLWQPWKTLGTPLVWVLHLAYVWVPIHLLLRAFSAFGWVSPSLSVHALTVGAAGGLMIGMMTRTAKGHTGRPLQASVADTAAYVLVLLAAVVRVALPLIAPSQTLHAILVSAVLWSAGFGLYAWCYGPLLTRPRMDGRPG
jgi:uncharacterized protein involved in response to NO